MDPYIGEIRAVGFTFAPAYWAFCDGELLSVSANNALFSLIGTIYGGNGTTSFALPNLMGRVPMGQGRGSGLTMTSMGERQGSQGITLTEAQMPSHNHGFPVASDGGSSNSPVGHIVARTIGAPPPQLPAYAPDVGSDPVTFNFQAIGTTGGNQAHQNTQPFLGLNYIISLTGVYPPRS